MKNHRHHVEAGSESLLSRRGLLQRAAGVAVAGALGVSGAARAEGATKGRLRQSIVHWCFQKYWSIEETCRIARELGCQSVELVSPADWPTLRKHGLVCAIARSHGFSRGMNNPKYWPECIASLRASIDACAEFGFTNVITFTGMREDIPDDVGIENCVKGYKKIIAYAEKKKVNLCLEMLNSRVDFTMKGHPGYQGDHIDYCTEIIRRVGSPRMKLLFDIYHVQIMDGDIIVRLQECKDVIGHYHTAGNPGRRELDDRQEINYSPIMEAIVATGYDGHVGQEFIPTRDPSEGLAEAVRLCDV